MPLAWTIRLEGKTDRERFEGLGWGLRTWDQWSFKEWDIRFCDDWPARHRLRLQAMRAGREGYRPNWSPMRSFTLPGREALFSIPWLAVALF